jgi:hypothetical protein
MASTPERHRNEPGHSLIVFVGRFFQLTIKGQVLGVPAILALD